jgi:hypothetical protein
MVIGAAGRASTLRWSLPVFGFLLSWMRQRRRQRRAVSVDPRTGDRPQIPAP